MPEELRAVINSAQARNDRRPPNPGVRVEVAKGERSPLMTFEAPHSDVETWELLIRDAFGTRSEAVYLTFLGQLSALCGSHWNPEAGASEPDGTELNAVLGIVNSVRPRSELEAMRAAQLVALHLLAMKVGARLISAAWVDAQNVVALTRLVTASSDLADSLRPPRRRTVKQHIKVINERHEHRHIHVGEGGAGNATQPRAPQRAIPSRSPSKRAALPGPDAGGEAMSGAGGERQRALPHARRRQGLRGAHRDS